MAGKGLGAVPSFQKVSGGEFVLAYMSGRLVWSEPNCAVPLAAKSQHCSSSYDFILFFPRFMKMKQLIMSYVLFVF